MDEKPKRRAKIILFAPEDMPLTRTDEKGRTKQVYSKLLIDQGVDADSIRFGSFDYPAITYDSPIEPVRVIARGIPYMVVMQNEVLQQRVESSKEVTSISESSEFHGQTIGSDDPNLDDADDSGFESHGKE